MAIVSQMLGKPRDAVITKMIQTRTGFEYVYAYPSDAPDDDSLNMFLVGGEVLNPLVTVRSTGAIDLAAAKRTTSSASLSDGQAEWNVRWTAEDGLPLQ